MTEAFVQVVRFLFGPIWDLCRMWHIPGTNVSAVEFAVFSLVIVRIVQVIRTLFGVYSGVQEDERRGRK